MAGSLQAAAKKVQQMETGDRFVLKVERVVDDPLSQLESLAKRANTRLIFLGSVSRKGTTLIKAQIADSS